jgi:hypothetical protein
MTLLEQFVAKGLQIQLSPAKVRGNKGREWFLA